MVSAIILSYNRCSEVLLTLTKLAQLSVTLPFELEIIVVDNASIDGTSAAVQIEFPWVKLVSKNQNNGIAGWNQGMEIASHPYFLMLDDDSCIESGLEEAVSYLEQHKAVGILAMDIVDQDFQGDPLLHPEDAWKDRQLIPGFIGCGAIIKKEVYDSIGGFADWIYVYTHEFEYSLRCMNAGFEVRFFKKGIVVHRVSKINRSKKRLRTYALRNEMAIIYKYFARDKQTYLWRTLLNNFKFIKKEGVKSGYFMMQGLFAFLKLKNQIKVTPVSPNIQEFYAGNFWSAKPVFSKKSSKKINKELSSEGLLTKK